MTRLSDERIAEIKALCDYATIHEQFAMVSTVETSQLAEEVLELRDEITLLRFNKWDAKNGHKRTETDLEKFRAEVDLLRKSRNHASSLLDCSERLKIACEALQQMARFEPSTPFIPILIAQQALTKIGELKSPKQALEKGNG